MRENEHNVRNTRDKHDAEKALTGCKLINPHQPAGFKARSTSQTATLFSTMMILILLSLSVIK